LICILYSISAKNTATAAVNENDAELTPEARVPAVMDIEAPIQATNDAEPTMVIVTPKRDFCKAKVVCMKPVQETSPQAGDDEQVP
jgi:hypothetical protein